MKMMIVLLLTLFSAVAWRKNLHRLPRNRKSKLKH